MFRLTATNSHCTYLSLSVDTPKLSDVQPPELTVHTATVVITTRNRRDELRRALRCVADQNGSYEVIVMDDASTDGTAEMVAREFPGVRLDVTSAPLGLIVQRNRAAEMATTPIIVSIDDDAVLTTPNVVAQTVALFDHPRVGAVTIPFIDVGQGDIPLTQAPDDRGIWVTATYIGTAHAVRRDLFQKLGGYRGYLFQYAEERDYCIRMLGAGYVVRLGTSDLLHHCASTRRVQSRRYIIRGRSSILYPWYNTPMRYLPFHLPRSAFNVIRFGIQEGHPLWAAWGVIRGLAACAHEFTRRDPIPVRAYRLDREMTRRVAVRLDEIEQRLEPMRFGPLSPLEPAEQHPHPLPTLA